MKKIDPQTKPDRGAQTPKPRKVAQILPVAAEAFLEHGFDAVTMDMVAARSGVSKATLYVYFSSKEDLFAAVVDEEVRLMTERFEITVPGDEDITSALRTNALSLVELFQSERTFALQRAVFGVLPRFPGLGAQILEAGPNVVTRKLAALIASARDDGRLDVADPMLAARQFLSLVRDEHDLRGLLALPPPDAATIARSIDEAIAMFLARYDAS